MTSEAANIAPEAWTAAAIGDPIGVDFETFYTSTYSVTELGHWAYTHDPRFHAYLVAVTDGGRLRCLEREGEPLPLDGAATTPNPLPN